MNSYPTQHDLDPTVLQKVINELEYALVAGETRVSMRAIMEGIRAEGISIDNRRARDYTDAALERVPAAAALVERRNTPGGRHRKLRPELLALDQVLAKGASIKSVEIVHEGRRFKISIAMLNKLNNKKAA